MATFSFKLPDLGEGIVESELVEWHVEVGDQVEEDDLLVDVQTEKAVVEVTAPVGGTVLALGGAPGDVLAVGAELVRFEVQGQTPDGAEATGTAAQGKAQAAPSSPSPQEPPDRERSPSRIDAPNPALASSDAESVLASPSLRRRAREAGIALADVPAQRADGRLSHKDFERFVAAGGAAITPPSGSQAKPATAPTRTPGSITQTKLRGARRVIARQMQATKRDIPHYAYIEEVDVTQLEALRVYLNEQRPEGQPKLTLLPFLIRGLVAVLGDFPQCNAHFDGSEEVLSEHADVHVGIATMTASGLMVPVVRNAQDLGLWELAQEIVTLAELARSGKAKPDQLRGSTITITSLGALGGVASTPVINAPETSIIGVNKMQERPVVERGQVVVRTMMNLSASFDHRVVDGYDGASLVQALRRLLQNPGALFVA